MKIALLGDVALFGCFSLKNHPGLLEKLSTISKYLSSFDYVIGNLETPFSSKGKPYGAKSAYIYSDPINIEVLKALHITHVNLANNHIYDFGKEGFETTLKVLHEANIHYFGVNGKSSIIEDNGSRICLNGFCCYSSNPLKMAKKYGSYGINRLNIGEMVRILKDNNEKGYFNIFSIHSGQEHVHFPSIDLIKIARQLSKEAPYVFYGHHPHVIQGEESVNNSLINYSLGNFCFDDVYNGIDTKPLITLSDDNRHGIIKELHIHNNQLVDHKTVLFNFNNEGVFNFISDQSLLEPYSLPLKSALSNPDYVINRKNQINSYIQNRKNKRNLKWYLKRMRIRYFKILLNARKNSKNYQLNVTDFLE